VIARAGLPARTFIETECHALLRAELAQSRVAGHVVRSDDRAMPVMRCFQPLEIVLFCAPCWSGDGGPSWRVRPPSAQWSSGLWE
jgi:hypothetical protein